MGMGETPLWVVKACQMPDGNSWFMVDSSGWLRKEDARRLVNQMFDVLEAIDTMEGKDDE